MAEEEGNKTEQPTIYKLAKAREKGTIARGVDLGFLTGITAFTCLSWAFGIRLGNTFTQIFRDALIGVGSLPEGNFSVLATALALFSSIATPVALFAGAIFLFVLVFEIVQTGFVWSLEPLRPDFSRLDPGKGLKRLFTARMLIETLKNIVKLAAYATVAYVLARGLLRSDIAAVTDGRGLVALMIVGGSRLLAAFIVLAFAFAVIDQIIIRGDFVKKMRMSRRELRRESRDREGDPRLKQKRKQLHGELVKLSQSVKNIRSADVLITNPDHVAIALRYDRKAMQAPLVVSVGINQVAQRLKRLAFIYSVPIVQNPKLARDLLRTTGLNKTIPESYYRAVAEIYNHLRRTSDRVVAHA